MENNEDKSLDQRVLRLEKTVADLKLMIEQLLAGQRQQQPQYSTQVPPPPAFTAKPAQSATPPVASAAPDTTPKRRSPALSFELPDHMKKVEFWLNKVGIGLLLFAVAFLFKYSIDKGWLTPWVRVAFGLGLGVILVALGFRTYEKRRHFSLVFMGGGIATFYITAFAAFQRLAIVSHTTAFAFMTLVTLFALLISLRQNDSILSLIGAVGGFGTPFMLYTGSGNIPALVLYSSILAAATSAIYFYRGWRSLMWLTVISGWSILLIALINGVYDVSSVALADQRAIQAGVLFAVVVFWIVPLLRQVMRGTTPAALSMPEGKLPTLKQVFGAVSDGQTHWLTISTPLIALGMSRLTWPEPSDVYWGWVTMVGAAVYWIVAYYLSRTERLKDISYIHTLVGGLLFTIALCLLFDGDTLFFAVATEAAVLHLIHHRTGNLGASVGGHVLFAILAMLLIQRIAEPLRDAAPLVNARALADIWTVALAVGLSYVFKPVILKRIYFIAGAFCLAGWFLRELTGSLPFVIITVEAFIFHIEAKRVEDETLRMGAHVFAVLLGLWLIGRLAGNHPDTTAVFSAYALSNLLAVVMAGVVAWLSKKRVTRVSYGLAAHALFMGWLLSELVTLHEGQGYVTIAWGVYGAILLILGLRRATPGLQTVALVTLLVVVGKLFLVDLAHLQAIFRIFLFMGFGAAFLALSYYFRALWKSDKDKGGNSSRTPT
ncbi:MAG: DUF2339 domain-containing protein [Candidatus Zixiibacteriota bacterium]